LKAVDWKSCQKNRQFVPQKERSGPLCTADIFSGAVRIYPQIISLLSEVEGLIKNLAAEKSHKILAKVSLLPKKS